MCYLQSENWKEKDFDMNWEGRPDLSHKPLYCGLSKHIMLTYTNVVYAGFTTRKSVPNADNKDEFLVQEF